MFFYLITVLTTDFKLRYVVAVQIKTKQIKSSELL